MVDRLVYNTVLSQAFSPCGNYLTASNIYGDVAVYSLSNVSSPTDDSKSTNGVQHPLHHVSGDGGHICSLVSTPKFLIAGGIGEIRGWTWKSVIAGKAEQQFKISVPAIRDRSDQADVNSLIYNSVDDQLCVGCGDNNIYIFNLEDGKRIRTLSGHTGFLHSVHLSSENQLVSASEDGTVRMWDMRRSTATNIIKPYEDDRLNRPELGKWVGAAAINDDWLVCGGGPRLSLWHLRSLEVTTVFPTTDLKGVHVAKFYEDRIFAGGAGPHFYQLSLNGQIYGQIPTSASTVYSAEFQETPHKILAIAGSSTHIDICTNFNYLDQKLTFAL